MSTDPRITPPKSEDGDDQEEGEVEFADTDDRERTEPSFREKGREMMKRFRDAFASLAS